jgi:hypothetical protein
MPLTTTMTTVVTRFPELANEPALTNAAWAMLIADANMEIPVTSWLDQASADRAGDNLVAHHVALEKLRLLNGLSAATAPGQLQSVTVGPISKTFVVPQRQPGAAQGDDVLSLTIYGREYMRLRKLFCRGRG